jgi:hypothetical protein
MSVGNDSLLFIHVPKAGGSWAISAMDAAGIALVAEREDKHHLALAECDVRGRFVFAFVREPLSWYGSTYNYRRRERFDDHGGDYLDKWLDLDFPDFLTNTMRDRHAFLADYYWQFVGPPERAIDFIGRYEQLADDLVQALRLAGQDFDEEALRACPPWPNQSGPCPYCPPDVYKRLVTSEGDVYRRFYPDVLEKFFRRKETPENSSVSSPSSVPPSAA